MLKLLLIFYVKKLLTNIKKRKTLNWFVYEKYGNVLAKDGGKLSK